MLNNSLNCSIMITWKLFVLDPISMSSAMAYEKNDFTFRKLNQGFGI